MNRSVRKVNPVVIAKGDDLGNGFCVVPLEWLPEKIVKVAQNNRVIMNGKCIISCEFIDRPWNATAVYSMDFSTEYTEKDL